MNIEEVREYCLSLKNTIECFPFDEVSLVFKVENKMFLLLGCGGASCLLEMQYGLCGRVTGTVYGG